ncbi:MAG: energy-coupling factor ABC transporter permease [Chromatiaceae bacterium]
MHIPEGMLSIPITAAAGLVSVATVAYAVSWVRRHMDDRKVVLMAVLGALIFALQMLNFPIQAGTSGHFAGGALAGILLGPWPAVLVMTAVLGVQAFLFGDGGVMALGANILNLGILAPLIGYLLYQAATRWRDTRGRRMGGAFLGAWLSTLLAALAVAAELGFSGTAHLGVATLAMGTTHALIGIGEGLITAALVAYLCAVRPDLLTGQAHGTGTRPFREVAVTLAAIALLATGLSFLASSAPDGLEWVYFEQGIGDAGAVARAPKLLGDGGPLADYQVAGLDNEALGRAIAGLIGLTIVGALLTAVAIRRRRQALAG